MKASLDARVAAHFPFANLETVVSSVVG